MAKIVYLFPGQGAQFLGMGKDFYDQFEVARKIYDDADKKLGFSLSKLCFEGPEEMLTQTINSQPAIYTTSWAIWEVLHSLGKIKQSAQTVYAGLSLGEFTAHSACGSWSFADGLGLVQKRAQFMQKAATETNGTMASVLNLDFEVIDQICQNVNGIVQSANYNSRSQIVISGEKKAVEEASIKLVEAGARKVIPLSVSGAFHSPLMAGAENGLREAVGKVAIRTTDNAVYSNVTADVVKGEVEIRAAVVKQLTAPVKWYQTIEKLVELGYTEYVELGPGKVLAGLIKRINKDVNVVSINNVTDIEKLN